MRYDNMKSAINDIRVKDIETMINLLQSNQEYKLDDNMKIKIISDKIWEELTDKIKKFGANNKKIVFTFICDISVNYNIDQKHMIKNYFNYVIENKLNFVNEKFLNFVENIIHTPNSNNDIFINYFISQMVKILNE